jgi:hypothetical protein
VFNRFISIVLFITLVFQCLCSLGVLAWFQANRSYIIAELCENRDKPAMHCNGQCVLMKKLKKLEDQQDKEHASNINKVEVTIVIPTMLVLPELIKIVLKNTIPPYNKSYSYLFSNCPFLPPKLNCIGF